MLQPVYLLLKFTFRNVNRSFETVFPKFLKNKAYVETVCHEINLWDDQLLVLLFTMQLITNDRLQKIKNYTSLKAIDRSIADKF